MRELADDVKEYIDVPINVFLSRISKQVELVPQRIDAKVPIMETIVNVYRHSFASFPDQRTVRKILLHDNAASQFNYGTNVYSESVRAGFLSSDLYNSFEAKSKPFNEMPVGILLDLYAWGGDGLANTMSAFWQKSQNLGKMVSFDQPARKALLASDWRMDQPIDMAELTFVFYQYWQHAGSEFTLRNCIESLSTPVLRGILAERFATLGYKTALTNPRHRSMWDAALRLFTGDTMSWFLLAQYPMSNYDDNDETTVTFEEKWAMRGLSQKYTPAKVAPFVLRSYPPSMIENAMEHDIDLGIFKSMMAGAS
jgi:hypothetical protein